MAAKSMGRTVRGPPHGPANAEPRLRIPTRSTAPLAVCSTGQIAVRFDRTVEG